MQNSKKSILIFGITGQDGSYLAQCLLTQSSQNLIHGVVRRLENNVNLNHLKSFIRDKRLSLHLGNITDGVWVSTIISKISPDIIYNLAGQTYVHSSFSSPVYTSQVNFIGVINIMEAILRLNLTSKTKLFQALTSEMYGQVSPGIILDQDTPMKPESPYAVSKYSSFHMIKVYRKAYKMQIFTAISFNHQSPRRGEHFVTRKVTKYVAQVSLGLTVKPLQLGNINSYRDWGHSLDYIKAFMLIMNLKEGDDFLVSTGISYSVRELVQLTFKYIGIQIKWIGQGFSEEGVCSKTGKIFIIINPQLFRPNEVPYLKGNASKLKQKTGWKQTISFERLIKQMLQHDVQLQSEFLKDIAKNQ